MAGLPWRRTATADPRDVALAGQLESRRAAAREAERELLAVEADRWGHAETAKARRVLEDRLDEAVAAAEAAYRVALGPVDDLPRVTYLRRLTHPHVKAADRERRELALARAHYRVAARDDLTAAAIAALPPSVGTRASALGPSAEH
jgi:hypothetical protein